MSRSDYIDEAGYVLTAGVYGLSGAEFIADLSLGKIRAANDELELNCIIVAKANWPWWNIRRYLALHAGRIMARACREFGWSAWRDAYKQLSGGCRERGQSLKGCTTSG